MGCSHRKSSPFQFSFCTRRCIPTGSIADTSLAGIHPGSSSSSSQAVRPWLPRQRWCSRRSLPPSSHGLAGQQIPRDSQKDCGIACLLCLFTFSNKAGNLVCELTSVRNPSKSSLTVFGDAMSEWASMINVRPRFFPGDEHYKNTQRSKEMFHLFRVKVHLLFQILAALTRDIQTSQKHSASEGEPHFLRIETPGKFSLQPRHWRCSTSPGRWGWSWRLVSSWHRPPSTCTSWWWTSGLCRRMSSSGCRSKGSLCAREPGTALDSSPACPCF